MIFNSGEKSALTSSESAGKQNIIIQIALEVMVKLVPQDSVVMIYFGRPKSHFLRLHVFCPLSFASLSLSPLFPHISLILISTMRRRTFITIASDLTDPVPPS